MSAALDREPAVTQPAAGGSLPPAGPAPALSVFDATMITVGIVIGAGIFQTPALVAANVASPAAMILAWALGGLLSFVGALTYAELATSYPSAGGDYTFVTRAYGRNVSFLFAWARSTVICTGSIALLGFILGDYLSRSLPLGPYSSALYAAGAVLLLTAINLIGLRSSSRVQNTLSILEIGGVLFVALLAFLLDAPAAREPAPPAAAGPGAFGLAMVFVLLTYGGWNEAAYVSAEVRGGPRAVLRSLMLSIAIITAVYLLFVSAILQGLGFTTLQSSQALGVEVGQRTLGAAGAQVIGVLVALASLTSMNSTMLAGARSNYAVARDWRAFAFMSHWQGRRSTPAVGFVVQAAIALALIAFGALEKGGFATMVEFTAPVFWFFFMLSGIALFILRRRHPHQPRPFSVPLYPIVPLVFVLMCAYLLYSSIMHAQSQRAAYVAGAVMISGALALWVVRRRSRT